MGKLDLDKFMEMFKGFLTNRYKLATFLALIGTVTGVIVGSLMLLTQGGYGLLVNLLVYVWIFSTVAAYICGGLFKAIGFVLRLASIGLGIYPLWLGLCIAGLLLACGIFLVAFVPIIPVYKAAREYGE